MCGRAFLARSFAEIDAEIRFADFAPPPNLMATWNLAPTQNALVCVRGPKTGGRIPLLMRWGLIPSWAKDAKIAFSTINARAETIDTKPAFRGAWEAGRRCLIITDGFYEWRRGDKKPFAIASVDGKLTVMAGLWEVWTSPQGEKIRTCTILTTTANALLAPLHERMPVILAEEDWPRWLGEVPATEAELKALLKAYPAEKMRLWPISKRVGNVKNDDADLLAPEPGET